VKLRAASDELKRASRRIQSSHYQGDKAELTQELSDLLEALRQAMDALEQARAAYIQIDRRCKAKASRHAA